MAEYIERESLVRQIICNMTEFVGAPDDVQKHDEQCNYAIDMIEDALIADVAPVVHGRWEWDTEDIYRCSNCAEKSHVKEVMGHPEWDYCPNCGAKMDGGNGNSDMA